MSPEQLLAKKRQVLKDGCPPFSPVGVVLPHFLTEGPEVTFQTACTPIFVPESAQIRIMGMDGSPSP